MEDGIGSGAIELYLHCLAFGLARPLEVALRLNADRQSPPQLLFQAVQNS
jgi:hypothetical protein